MQVELEAKLCKTTFETQGATALLVAARQAWKADVKQKSNKQDSSYVRDISNSALGLGLKLLHEDTSSGYAVDIAIPALKVAIEADGPTHRSRNTGQLLGATVVKQRHVRAAGWHLVNLAHDDWDQLCSRQQKLHYIQRTLSPLLKS